MPPKKRLRAAEGLGTGCADSHNQAARMADCYIIAQVKPPRKRNESQKQYRSRLTRMMVRNQYGMVIKFSEGGGYRIPLEEAKEVDVNNLQRNRQHEKEQEKEVKEEMKPKTFLEKLQKVARDSNRKNLRTPNTLEKTNELENCMRPSKPVLVSKGSSDVVLSLIYDRRLDGVYSDSANYPSRARFDHTSAQILPQCPTKQSTSSGSSAKVLTNISSEILASAQNSTQEIDESHKKKILVASSLAVEIFPHSVMPLTFEKPTYPVPSITISQAKGSRKRTRSSPPAVSHSRVVSPSRSYAPVEQKGRNNRKSAPPNTNAQAQSWQTPQFKKVEKDRHTTIFPSDRGVQMSHLPMPSLMLAKEVIYL